MSTRIVVLVVLVLVVAGCGGAAPTEEAAPVAGTPEASPSEASSPERGPDVAGTHVGEVDGVAVGVDLAGRDDDLVADAQALQEAVGDEPMTFAVARIENRSDAPASLDAIEIEDEGGEVLVLEPAGELVRRLRSEVDLYDTDTFDQATQLLETVEGFDPSADPGESGQLLLGAEGRMRSIATITAIGSFGQVQLQAR